MPGWQNGKGSRGAERSGQEFTTIETFPSAHNLFARSERAILL
jgi:hypothetical protein